ncbi:MAG TPA: ATP-binding protein [Mycobacteriales bacterium]|jgi:two-component system phosphate regulon sensor histidine kinase PhoR|nr:ATP-binding protein [Mycobacteriales bacterium]
MTERENATATGPAMPPRLRWLLVVMATAGLAAILVAVPSAVRDRPEAGNLLLAVAFFLIGDVALMNIRFGRSRYTFTWAELALVFGLVMLPPGWLVLVATLCVAAGQVMLRRPLAKAVFNVSINAAGAGLAWLTVTVLGRTATEHASLTSSRAWLTLAAGTLVFAVWSSGTVGMAVAFSQDLPVRAVLRKGAFLQAMVWLGNTVAGVGVAMVTQQSGGALIVLPFFLALLYAAYRGYLRADEDRDTWQVLQDTSRDLSRLRRTEIAEVVLDRAAALFKADFVELMLVDDEPSGRVTTWRGTGDETRLLEGRSLEDAATFWPRAHSEREPYQLLLRRAPTAQRRELESLGLEQCVVVPIATTERCLGTLRVGFAGVVRIRTRDLQVLRTFANQLATSVENARLYEEMREERTKLSRVVDNTSDGILSVDARGRITSWNPAMARISGLSAESILGSSFTLGHAGTDADGTPVSAQWLWDKLGGDAQAEAQVSIGSNESGKRWLHLSLAAVRSSTGVIEVVVVVVRDVTALREAAQAKEEFLATVSHELRTPLTSLRGWVSTLLRPEFQPNEEERREVHERLMHQTGRLQRLIEDVLSVSSMDRGQFVVQTVPVGIDEVIEKSLAEFRRQVPDRPVEHVRAGLAGTALADAGRVEQVINNLVSNADKYSPPETPIEVRVAREADKVVVTVSDHGFGIPEDQREAVFERFHRLGHHMTREASGTGLGLHIARRLVEAMGGRIWVDSRLGEGSTFTFTLPAAPLVAKGADVAV